MIPPHRIRGNDTTRVPRNFLWLDTESVGHTENGRNVQTWRMAVTCFDGWDQYRKRRREPEWCRWATAGSMWLYADAISRAKTRLILCAHNIGFDLRIADAFRELAGLGWKLRRPSMTDSSVTVIWRRDDGATIVAIDSYAWLPKSLADIGLMVGQPKLPDPDPDDEAGWWDRCTTDVNILRAAMLHLVTWIEEEDLGTFQKTGAAQSWTTWRHRFLTHTPIVHDDERVREIEVESVYAGRTEAWKWGVLRGRRWTEFDCSLAYARVCRDLSLPIGRPVRVTSTSSQPVYDPTGRRRLLCHATVKTTVPVLPIKTADGICWPVGSYEGWYWERELAEAVKAGAVVEVDKWVEYPAAPALRAFATWAIELIEGGPDERTAVQAAAVKHWTRAIVGKAGAKYQQWDELDSAPDDGVSLVRVWDRDLGRECRLMTCSGRAWWSDHEELWQDALPAVMSAVVSETRIRLWHLMCLAGLGNVAYVDTDGLIVNVPGARRLRERQDVMEAYGVREKRTTSDLHIDGPRQLTFDGMTRWAGIPRRAERTGHHEWHGERWESLEEAMQGSRLGQVVITPTVWRPEGVDKRRLHVAGGKTEALEVQL